MPLFVYGLRLFTLFLNVYESYKVLKLPPPSSRNNGLPSQRALSQRKRDMKGVITVWIVWCCFVTYERFVEPLVSIFVPFYDEVKSIFLLFLIMTRARGAEPIFLHVIRPFLRPYTPTLDLLLDFFLMLGDMAYTAILGPFLAIRNLWKRSDSGSEEASDGDGSSGRETPVDGNAHQPNGTLGHARSSSSLHARQPMPRNVSSESAGSSSSIPQSRAYEIWNPPQPAHSDSEETLHDDFGPTEITFMTEEAKAANEWRQYPAFPSAYPATPAFVRKKLPSMNQSVPQPSLMGILETADRHDFDQHLTQEEPESGSEHDPNEDLLRSPGPRGLFSEDDLSAEEGEYDEDDEDVFNTTLKTPPPARPRPLGPISGQASNRSSIGSILANNNGIKSRSSNASLHSRNGSAVTAPAMHRRQSSSSSVNSGRSVRSRESIPKALRTGPMLKQADVGAESDEDEESDDGTPVAATGRTSKIAAKSTIRPGQATRPIQPKSARSTNNFAKIQPAKSGPTRKPSRPLSDASLRSTNGAAAGEKPRPVTQRRNTPLTQATNRKENS